MEGKEHYYITNTRRHEITKPWGHFDFPEPFNRRPSKLQSSHQNVYEGFKFASNLNMDNYSAPPACASRLKLTLVATEPYLSTRVQLLFKGMIL
jgi:hypothetical protein